MVKTLAKTAKVSLIIIGGIAVVGTVVLFALSASMRFPDEYYHDYSG